MIEIMMVKTAGNGLQPATAKDADEYGKIKIGQPVRVALTQVKQRSLKWHKMYWGGLLQLAMDAWEPQGGLISSTEKSTLNNFADWLDAKSGNSGAIKAACNAFMDELAQRRSQRIDTPSKSIEALHRWVKAESGLYDLEMTPAGVRKVERSINFNSMDADEWQEFYKQAFGVCWRFILSRSYGSEEELQNCIDNLVEMG
jgi:hypothetical protein